MQIFNRIVFCTSIMETYNSDVLYKCIPSTSRPAWPGLIVVSPIPPVSCCVACSPRESDSSSSSRTVITTWREGITKIHSHVDITRASQITGSCENGPYAICGQSSSRSDSTSTQSDLGATLSVAILLNRIALTNQRAVSLHSDYIEPVM